MSALPVKPGRQPAQLYMALKEKDAVTAHSELVRAGQPAQPATYYYHLIFFRIAHIVSIISKPRLF